jgi:adenosylcobinamide kinase/adenosylcobinamide-phosphate guanylyltransferase
MITLVLGGTRSGKSAVAERLAAGLPAPLTYLATAVVDPADDDFAARVAAHRRRRPEGWTTVESGSALPADLAGLSGTVLIDALGTWVAATPDFAVDIDDLCAVLRTRPGDTVVVSDEVGLGVHPETELGRRFRDVLGGVNQAVGDVADRVLLVVAGRVLPLERI